MSLGKYFPFCIGKCRTWTPWTLREFLTLNFRNANKVRTIGFSLMFNFLLFKDQAQTSLVVQWLSIHIPTAEGMGSIPRQGIKILNTTQFGQKKPLGNGKKNYIYRYIYIYIYTHTHTHTYTHTQRSVSGTKGGTLFGGCLIFLGASLVAQMVKNLPVMQETWVWQPIPTFSLENSMEPGGLQSTQSQRVGHDWAANTFTFLHFLMFLTPVPANNLSYYEQ